MPNNNKMKVLMWVAGVLSSIIITFLVGLTNHVIANDKLSRERDTNIKTEQVEGDQKIQECINEKFADIIGIEKSKVLRLTRQKELKISIEEIFNSRIHNKKAS